MHDRVHGALRASRSRQGAEQVPGAVEPNPALLDQFTEFRPIIGSTRILAATGVTEPLMATTARATSGASAPLRAPVRICFILFSSNFIIAIFWFVSFDFVKRKLRDAFFGSASLNRPSGDFTLPIGSCRVTKGSGFREFQNLCGEAATYDRDELPLVASSVPPQSPVTMSEPTIQGPQAAVRVFSVFVILRVRSRFKST